MAVTRVKALFNAAKAGHTGTLDPMATGLLPVTLGEATKFSHGMLEADKAYLATVRLGVTTTTGDLEGEVLTRSPVDADPERVEAALARFRGDIVQTPPMYSALKHAGRPLYEYARAGTQVARAPRHVTIRTLELRHCGATDVRISVACSKGTYIRVLAEDIGKTLGCGATLAELRRTHVGRFSLDAAVTLDRLSEMTRVERLERLLPSDALVAALPSVDLDAEQALRIVRGQAVNCTGIRNTGLVRVYGPDSAFLGVADADREGRVVPRRLLSSASLRA
jgi:tRNA pseudouridine55 synthase